MTINIILKTTRYAQLEIRNGSFSTSCITLLQNCLLECDALFYFLGTTARSEPRSPPCRAFTITLRHTTLDRTPLDEWSARRRDFNLTIHNTHKRQDIHAPGGIRSRNPSRWAVTAPRLRPRGQWDCPWHHVLLQIHQTPALIFRAKDPDDSFITKVGTWPSTKLRSEEDKWQCGGFFCPLVLRLPLLSFILLMLHNHIPPLLYDISN